MVMVLYIISMSGYYVRLLHPRGLHHGPTIAIKKDSTQCQGLKILQIHLASSILLDWACDLTIRRDSRGQG